jgi:hypothetical protein
MRDSRKRLGRIGDVIVFLFLYAGEMRRRFPALIKADGGCKTAQARIILPSRRVTEKNNLKANASLTKNRLGASLLGMAAVVLWAASRGSAVCLRHGVVGFAGFAPSVRDEFV